jgi:hypothetical protein
MMSSSSGPSDETLIDVAFSHGVTTRNEAPSAVGKSAMTFMDGENLLHVFTYKRSNSGLIAKWRTMAGGSARRPGI